MKKVLLVILIGLGCVFGVYVVLYQGIWRWGICRKYCPYERSMLVTRKTGAPAGKDAYATGSQMGVQGQMAGPGRHFLNPWVYSARSVPNVLIPSGKIGVVKSNLGKDLPEGRFLAGPGEKGTLRTVLTPGTWRVNSHGQKVEVVDATIIAPGYVGVQTLREGKDKGILSHVLQPGYYHINPREKRIDIVEIGYRVWHVQTEFDGDNVKKDSGVSFPLADGKEMYIDFTVVWGIFPQDAPRIIEEYGTVEMVESKIIVPQILSICKNIGSNYTTIQFIEGETRERFQNEVTTALQKIGKEKGVHMLIALVRGFHPAQDIKEIIQAGMIAEEEKDTLLIEQKTDQVAAQLEQAEKIVDIAVKDFNAETSALVAGEREGGEKKAAEIRAKAEREVAALKKQTAEVDATALKIGGQAKADVIEAQKKADAKQLELLISAFGGPGVFNLYTFAENLPKDLKIKYRYAGPGTLWTDAMGNLKDVASKKLLEYLETKEKK